MVRPVGFEPTLTGWKPIALPLILWPRKDHNTMLETIVGTIVVAAVGILFVVAIGLCAINLRIIIKALIQKGS